MGICANNCLKTNTYVFFVHTTSSLWKGIGDCQGRGRYTQNSCFARKFPYYVHHVHKEIVMKATRALKPLPRVRTPKTTAARKAKPAAAAGKPSGTVQPLRSAAKIKLGLVSVDVERVSVASARTEMPGLIRASAETGRAFLIHNAKNASAAGALLINPAVLEQRLQAAATPRTLGQLIDTLPFKRRGSRRVVVNRPDDFAPARRLPGQPRAIPQR
jgi:hypothetical protein